jgi:hypothetical protein
MTPNGILRGLGLISMVVSVAWWLSFLDRVGQATGVSVEALFREEWLCLIYTTQRCQIAYSVAELAGSLAYRPFLTWIGIGLLILSSFLSMEVVDDEWPRDRREPRF